jgi:hypothetical protein
LYRYVNGSGYYLKDYCYGAGHCTWQIGPEGLAWLRKRGVTQDGDHVSPRDRDTLLQRGLIWTTGEGGPPGLVAPALSPVLEKLAADLVGWARQGGLRELTEVLCDWYGDQRDQCFSHSFLTWLGQLTPPSVAGLDGISAPDFDDLATPSVLARLTDPLHRHFAEQGNTHVLWRLACLVGLVSRQRLGSTTCPPAWEQQRALCRLFALLAPLEPTRDPRAPIPGRAASSLLCLRPFLRWDVDLQQVVIVLPEQQLPPGVHGLTWEVTPGSCPQPEVWRSSDGWRVREASSHALPPASHYTVTTALCRSPAAADQAERAGFALPEETCVLFDLDGDLLAWEDGAARSPGEYLALVRTDQRDALGARAGVAAVERIVLGPVGWRGWQGWRMRLAPGADLPPYLIAGAAAVSWEVDPAPLAPVVWREALPVWPGSWPRLRVSDGAAFAGAVLEVTPEDPAGPPRFLRFGSDLRLQPTGPAGAATFHLGEVRALHNLFGSLRLTCRVPAAPDQPPLTARFIRLPSLRLGYVPDPLEPNRARAVRVQGPDLLLRGLRVEAETETLPDGEGVILRARHPVHSPGVDAVLPAGHGALRLRVPVSRCALQQGGQLRGDWRPLPLIDLDLASVGIDDRVFLELHEPADLENGALLCRLVGGGEVAAGRALARPAPLAVFALELHRWRDALGTDVQGTIQVRGRSRWLEVARLLQRQVVAPPPPPGPEPVGERAQLMTRLEKDLDRGERGPAWQLAEECLARARAPSASAADCDLLPLAAARAFLAFASDFGDLRRAADCLAGLAERTDLPEALVLRETVTWRLASWGIATETLTLERVERLSWLPRVPRRLLLEAEGWYHLARNVPCGSAGAWGSALELAERFLGLPETRGDRMERRDARLLAALSRLMLAQEPMPSEPEEADAWLQAVGFAVSYVRTPWRQPLSPENVPTLGQQAPTIFQPADADLLRFITAQARGENPSGPFAESLGQRGTEWFFAVQLLRARQARWSGRLLEARSQYERLLEQTQIDGPDFLLAVAVEEMP